MGCKNKSTQAPNSKHFHFEPSFYKLAACHVKTVNLRRAVGCEPCLFVSHFLLFVNYSTLRLLKCSMARFIPHFWKSQTIFTAWQAHMLVLPTVISCCQNSYLAFVAIHYILKWYLWNTEDTILSPHFESFLNHTILKRLFNSREQFFPACIDRTRKGSTQTSSDKERCRPLLTEGPKTADNGIKNC